VHALPGRIEASPDVRGRVRRKLFLRSDTVVAGSPSTTATVHNLSETGLLIETDVELSVGDSIEVDLPRAGLKSAKIVWTDDRLFGCSFAGEISTATVSAAVLRGSFLSSSENPELVGDPDPEIDPVQGDGTDPDAELSPAAIFWTIAGLVILSWGIVGALGASVVWLLA